MTEETTAAEEPQEKPIYGNVSIEDEGGFHRRHYTATTDGGKCWGLLTNRLRN